MSKEIFPIKAFSGLKTPFYYYDTDLLRKTLQTLTSEAGKYGFLPHYAIKANANPVLLKIIASYGLGADCVSGGEVKAALEAGFPAGKIVFAGVGKSDWEIEIGLDNDIFCFNAESLPELDVINEIAARKGKTARVALRVNPDVDAHTHAKITTGRQENKFGINAGQVESVIKHIGTLPNVEFIGLHFHIGSQITEMEVFATLCERVNGIVSELQSKGVEIKPCNRGFRRLFRCICRQYKSRRQSRHPLRARTFSCRPVRKFGFTGIVRQRRRGEKIRDFRCWFLGFDTSCNVRCLSFHGKHKQLRSRRQVRCGRPDLRIFRCVRQGCRSKRHVTRGFRGNTLGRCIRGSNGFAI